MEERPHTGGAFITQREIFDEVRATRTDVQKLIHTVSDLREVTRNHESRLSVVERKIWAASGVAAFLAGGGGTLLSMIVTRGS